MRSYTPFKFVWLFAHVTFAPPAAFSRPRVYQNSSNDMAQGVWSLDKAKKRHIDALPLSYHLFVQKLLEVFVAGPFTAQLDFGIFGRTQHDFSFPFGFPLNPTFNQLPFNVWHRSGRKPFLTLTIRMGNITLGLVAESHEMKPWLNPQALSVTFKKTKILSLGSPKQWYLRSLDVESTGVEWRAPPADTARLRRFRGLSPARLRPPWAPEPLPRELRGRR